MVIAWLIIAGTVLAAIFNQRNHVEEVADKATGRRKRAHIISKIEKHREDMSNRACWQRFLDMLYKFFQEDLEELARLRRYFEEDQVHIDEDIVLQDKSFDDLLWFLFAQAHVISFCLRSRAQGNFFASTLSRLFRVRPIRWAFKQRMDILYQLNPRPLPEGYLAFGIITR